LITLLKRYSPVRVNSEHLTVLNLIISSNNNLYLQKLEAS